MSDLLDVATVIMRLAAVFALTGLLVLFGLLGSDPDPEALVGLFFFIFMAACGCERAALSVRARLENSAVRRRLDQ